MNPFVPANDDCGCDFPIANAAEMIGLYDADELTIATDVGSLSCCDAWFHVPASWIERVTLRIYGRVFNARVLLSQIALADAVATGAPEANQSGIALSIRGRPCTSFQLTCQATPGDALTGGHFYLQSWHAKASLGSAVTSPGTGLAGAEIVSAVLVARDPDTGTLREVATDDEGRLRTVRGIP